MTALLSTSNPSSPIAIVTTRQDSQTRRTELLWGFGKVPLGLGEISGSLRRANVSAHELGKVRGGLGWPGKSHTQAQKDWVGMDGTAKV